MFTGLASEPGARSLNVTVWGYEAGLFHRIWMSYTIDFAALLMQSCKYKIEVSLSPYNSSVIFSFTI